MQSIVCRYLRMNVVGSYEWLSDFKLFSLFELADNL